MAKRNRTASGKKANEDERTPENWIYEYWVVKPKKAGPPEFLGPLHCREYTEHVLALALSEDPRSSMIAGGYVGTDEQCERCGERYRAQVDALETSKAMRLKGMVRPTDEFKVEMFRNIAWNTAIEAGFPL